MKPLPIPPPEIDRLAPEVADYLRELLTELQSALDLLDRTKQTIGRPVLFPYFPRATLTGTPFNLRTGDQAKMVFCPDYNNDGALVIADGTAVRSMTIGPPLT